MSLVASPGTGAEQNIPSAVFQSQSHTAVQILSCNNGTVIAIIIFQEIHPPLRKGLRIHKLMLIASGIACTGKVSRTGIHAELQALRMYIVSHCLHTVGKFRRIRNQSSLGIPLPQRPAIINYQIIVSAFQQTALNHNIGSLHDQLLTDVLSKCVPGIPPHRRCQFNHIFLHSAAGCGLTIDNHKKSCKLIIICIFISNLYVIVSITWIFRSQKQRSMHP